MNHAKLQSSNVLGLCVAFSVAGWYLPYCYTFWEIPFRKYCL